MPDIKAISAYMAIFCIEKVNFLKDVKSGASR